MVSKGEIDALRASLGISEDELITHKKAYDVLSTTGSEKALNAFLDEKRDKIASFYATLRKWGVYNYRPDKRTFQVITDYYDAWLYDVRNDPDRPENQSMTLEELLQNFKTGMEDFLKKINFRDRKIGNMPEALKPVWPRKPTNPDVGEGAPEK
jgi:hypothetical protein